MPPPWFLLGCVALAAWGLGGLTQKLASNHIGAKRCSVWFTVGFLPVSAAILAAGAVELHPSATVVAIAAAGGVLLGLGTLFMFAALERGGSASVVIPLVALYPLLAVVLSRIWFDERLSVPQIAGITLAILSAWLLSKE